MCEKLLTNTKQLKLLALNVCGLKSKLRSNDFEDFIQNYDLVCLSETKLTEFDEIIIDGYNLNVLNKCNTEGESEGIHGIALLTKKSYNPVC